MTTGKRTNTMTGALALAGALTLLAGAPAGSALAADGVKCYGISAAGENDCANKAAGHSCAGETTLNYSGMDFQAVKSKEACLEQEGKLTTFKGINPAYADKTDQAS